MSKDRFDLEMDISYCRNIVDDIDMLYENVLDNPKFEMPPETADRIANALLGLKELYEMRFDRLNDTFCQTFELNEYHEKEEATDYLSDSWYGTDTMEGVSASLDTGTITITTPMDGDVDLWNTHNTIVTGDYDKQISLKFT